MSYPHEDDNRDHWTDTAETLLYGDPSTAAEKFKSSTYEGIKEFAAQERRRAEHARSMALVDRFKADNPSFTGNSIAAAATERALYEEQANDLHRIGVLDLKKFQEEHGRDPTLSEIANAHLTARSNGARVRSAEQLFDAAAARIEEQMPGVRRRIRDREHNQRRSILERMKADAARHGLSLEEHMLNRPASRPANVDGGEPATADSMAQDTFRKFGSDVDTPERTQNRKSAIEKMRAARGQDPDVRVNRGPMDRRFPDRQPSA